jgi:hypothetical protein
MPARRVVARVELADIRRGLREAEKLVEECASKGGTSYVEKVSPTAVEVGCVYEAPEEAVVEKVGALSTSSEVSNSRCRRTRRTSRSPRTR